jgi:hypothetical protein
MRKAWLLLLLASPAAAITICPTIKPPNIRQFSQGCYTGNGSDARVITSGIINPGVLLIVSLEVPSGGTTDRMVFTIPELGAGVACQTSGAFFGGACGTGIIEAVSAGSFTIGTDTRANKNGEPFCWWEWGLNTKDHGTFQYTGNGTSPRTITVTGTPDAAAVLTGTSFTYGRQLYVRTKDMPVTDSYGWFNVGESARTQLIRDFTTNGIVVGSDANVNGTVYNGWWWAAGDSDYGGAVKWTGNGLSNVGCAAASDTQVISTPCPIQQIFTTGCTLFGCDGAQSSPACPSTAPMIRGQNMGLAVIGPGHTPNDFDSAWYAGPFNEVMGNLTDSTFTAAGASSHGLNLNNNGQTYYAWVTCSEPGTGVGTVNLQNWCFAANTVACWEMEEASNANRTNNNCNTGTMSGGTTICGFSTCACDLSAANTVAKDTTNKVVGSASALFTGSNDLTSPFANSGTQFNLATTASWGAFLYPTADISGIAVRFAGNSSSLAYEINRDISGGGSAVCSVVDGGNVTHTAIAAGALPLNQWHQITCVFDDTANTLTVYADGNSVTPATTSNSMRSVSGTGLEIGVNSWVGNIDESFVYSGALQATDVCRISSCGLNGTLCSCYGSDQTVYIDPGRNSQSLGCAMPVCNKINPS